jgi:hypothetical protein
MIANGTYSSMTTARVAGLGSTTGAKFVAPLLGGVFAMTGTHAIKGSEASGRFATPPWVMVSTIGRGTARSVVARTNYYQPKTALGRRLLALRQSAIAAGMPLMPVARIVEELDRLRGRE